MIQVDESKIRQEIAERDIDLKVHQNWFTPAGRERSAPMYEVTIKNEYLKKSRFLKKQSLQELEDAARGQREKWAEQELKARVAAEKANIKEEAESDWVRKRTSLESLLEELGNILKATIDVDDRLDWDSLLDKSSFEAFNFKEEAPEKPKPSAKPAEPRKGILDYLLPFLWNKKATAYSQDLDQWRQKLNLLGKNYRKDLAAWEERKAEAQQKWESKKREFERRQAVQNASVKDFKQRYEAKQAQAVIEYIQAVFEESQYPEGVSLEYDIGFDPNSETLVVDLSLPSIEAIPSEADYRFKKTTAEIIPVSMKVKDREALYEAVLNQTVIRTIHEVFEADYVHAIMQVVLNGWVTYIDASTGQEKTSCIVSVSSDREVFETYNLAMLEPKECIRSMKGVVAGPLSAIQPVKPILQLDREDSRFVESEDVLADLNSTTNLAEIGWEEFEHLVRELFSKLFSSGSSEVRVTQASSDGGIDAIAFDDDPIRGGKFVIQAKRYTKVVPVSAVRDLYGTMISEGATKGILVTTAHYGRDSRSFVKDKPITLIDGSNLVYLLEEHGHKVRIDVAAARAKLKGSL